MKNLLERTMERILAIEDNRAKKQSSISSELNATYAAIESQRKRVTEAAASADIEVYRQEQTRLKELQDNAKLLEQWARDLAGAPKVERKESEETIAALLKYERRLISEYKVEAGKLLIQLKALTEKHIEESEEAEKVLKAWTTRIQPNYISANYRQGSEALEDGRYRCKEPVTIHPVAYTGWTGAVEIKNLFRRKDFEEAVAAAEEEENGT